jgi:hypothetical protein
VKLADEEHDSNVALSRLHSKLDPASLAETPNDALEEMTVPLGPEVIDVSGDVLSILTWTEAWPVSPASFVAAQVTVVPAVSPETVAGPQPDVDVTPECGSDTSQLTETSLRYHPFDPCVPVRCAAIAGGLASYLKPATPGAVSPAPFVHDPPTDAFFESGPA